MKKITIYTIALLPLTILAGCASVDVRPVSKIHNISHVCIENNPKVVVANFTTIVADVFQDHGITTKMYNAPVPNKCEYKLTYTALRSWDFKPYLSHAELRLFKKNKRIGYAEYHITRGFTSFSLKKWASVKKKMTPVINKLLAQYKK